MIRVESVEIVSLILKKQKTNKHTKKILIQKFSSCRNMNKIFLNTYFTCGHRLIFEICSFLLAECKDVLIVLSVFAPHVM